MANLKSFDGANKSDDKYSLAKEYRFKEYNKKRYIKTPHHKLYNTKAWRQLSKQVKVDRGGKCEVCGSDQFLKTHHLVSVADAPESALDRGNLQVLCARCHSREHARLMKDE